MDLNITYILTAIDRLWEEIKGRLSDTANDPKELYDALQEVQYERVSPYNRHRRSISWAWTSCSQKARSNSRSNSAEDANRSRRWNIYLRERPFLHSLFCLSWNPSYYMLAMTPPSSYRISISSIPLSNGKCGVEFVLEIFFNPVVYKKKKKEERLMEMVRTTEVARAMVKERKTEDEIMMGLERYVRVLKVIDIRNSEKIKAERMTAERTTVERMMAERKAAERMAAERIVEVLMATMAWMNLSMTIAVLVLRQLLILAWIMEFPSNFRHPCTTMPWTIWPALVVLWGVCWMFYPEDSWSFNEGSGADPGQASESHPWLDGNTPYEFSFDNLNFPGPTFLNYEAAVQMSIPAAYDYTIGRVGGESSQGPLTSLPPSDSTAHEKQPVAGFPNGEVGCSRTTNAEERISPSVAPPQTQLSFHIEQDGPSQLEPISGTSGGRRDPNPVVEDPPFKCSAAGCGQAFAYKSSLQAHVKRHDKPFVCNECGHRFGSKKELERHQVNIHSEDKPFVCAWPQCKRSRQGWSREDNYHRHVRNVHKGNYDPADALSAAGSASSSSPASRKRQREDSDGSDSSLGGELKRRDERIRELEQMMDRELKKKDEKIADLEQTLSRTREWLNDSREMYTQLKEHKKLL